MKPSHISGTTTTHIPIPKLTFSSASTTSTTNTPNSASSSFSHHSYEPTSVLDPNLNSSPSSSARAASDHLLDNPTLPISDPFDEWDPLTFLLDSSDNPSTTATTTSSTAPVLPPPSLSEGQNTTAFDLDSIFPPFPPTPAVFEQIHLDQLIRAVQAVESNDRHLACTILARLNHHLVCSSGGPPLQRAACYFKDALQSVLFLLDDDPLLLPISSLDLVRKISAFKAFSDLSPVPQFTSFTANQTILDAVLGDFSRPIHVIDFEIGLGGQWSSFLHEVAARCRTHRSIVPPSVQITAVVAEETLETGLMAENLRDFAANLGIRFDVDFVCVRRMGPVALGNVRLAAGENVAVTFTPTVVRMLGGGGCETVLGFLRFVRRMAPKVVVFIDGESCCSDFGPDRSFRRSFVTGLEYFSVVLESLDSAAAAAGFDEDHVGRIERALIRPKIWAAVRSWAVRALPWRELVERAGFKSVPFTEFTESQAEWLTRRAPIGGYHVSRRDGSILLTWQGRELSATSAWRC